MRIARVLGAIGLLAASACLDNDTHSPSGDDDEQQAVPEEGPVALSVAQQSLESTLCGSIAGLQANAPWPMFGGCPTHAAQSSQYGPTGNQRNWATYLYGNVKSSPAVAADGSIFVGSDAGKLFKINRATGAIVKQDSTWGPVRSSPAIGTDGTVYVGDDSGTFYAYNPTTLLAKWTYPWIGAVKSSPAIGSDGTIYFGSDDGKLYALNPNGTKKWSYLASGPIGGSPAIGSDGTVYFPSGVTLYALNPNGTLKWSKAIGFPITSSAAIGRFGRVYTGAGDKLFALDTATGNILWQKSLGSCTIYAPAIDANGVIYAGTGFSFITGGALFAVSPDGDILWHFDVFGGVQSTPIIDNAGNIYFGANDNNIYAVDATGQQIWKYATLGNVQSSPALDSTGAVIIGANDNKLYSIGVGATRVANGGACTSDGQCAPGLVCGLSNGSRFGLAAGTRACVVPTCENKIQDPDETEVDCGGPCGSCTNVCSLACTVGQQVQSPALEVLSFSKASFIRPSFATYNIGAAKLGIAGGHVLRFDERGDGKGRLALFEGARTNRVRFSEQLGHTPEWRMPSGGTPIVESNDYAASPLDEPTADRMVAPAGGYPSRTQTLSDNMPAGVLSAWLRNTDTGAAASSTRAVLVDAQSRWYSNPATWSLTGTWERRSMLTTATTCPVDLSFSHKAGWPGNVATFPQLGTADFLAWGLQLEEGSFASSYIPTTDDPETRSVDRLVFEPQDVPAWVRNGLWQIDVAPIFARTEIATTDEMTLVAWGNGQLTLGRDSNGGVLKIASGATNYKLSIDWVANTKLTITLDFAGHTIAVSGARSGDGSVGTGSIAIPAGSLSVGARLDGTRAAFARLSELRRVGTQTVPCVRDPDCAVCGDGVVSSTEACDTAVSAWCDTQCSTATPSSNCEQCGRGQACPSWANSVLFDLQERGPVCIPVEGCTGPSPQCGQASDPCGKCIATCTPDCSSKHCGDDRWNNCGAACTGLCAGVPGCSSDHDCGAGRWCDPQGGVRIGAPGQSACVLIDCAVAGDDPRYCGFAGAICGEVCPSTRCIPDCEERACGTSPGDGCGGSCGTCSAGDVCAETGQCVHPLPPSEISGLDQALVEHDRPVVDATVWLQGAFDNRHGFATYSLPIEVPPGKSEMEPDVALVYSSVGGPSALGHGWSLSGLSSIQRCATPDSEKYDGVHRPRITSSDRYCLDGKPLELAQDVRPEPGDQLAFYRVLGSPHLRVIATSIDEHGPSTFIVKDGTGRSQAYGETNDSSDFFSATANPDSNRGAFNTGEKSAWWISSTFDEFGNYIHYDYDVHQNQQLKQLDSGVHANLTTTTARYLRMIAYTGTRCKEGDPGCAENIKPDRAVKFEYTKTRPEIGEGNAPLVNPRSGEQRYLSKIAIFMRDALVREYRVTQQLVRSDRRLTAIAKCHPHVRAGQTEAVCTEPISFGYDAPGELFAESDEDFGAFPASATPPNAPAVPLSVYALDANGDGLTDVLHRKTTHIEETLVAGPWALKLARLDSDGAFTFEESQLDLGLVQHNALEWDPGRSARERIYPTDVNGDQKDDLIIQRWEKDEEQKWHLNNVVLLGDGAGGFAVSQSFESTGVLYLLPRRGRLPWLAVCRDVGENQSLRAQIEVYSNIAGRYGDVPNVYTPDFISNCGAALVADYKSDGVSELLVRGAPSGRTQLYALVDGAFENTGVDAASLAQFYAFGGGAYEPTTIDFDGDGLQDLYVATTSWDHKPKFGNEPPDHVNWTIWYGTMAGYEFAFTTEELKGPSGLPAKDDPSSHYLAFQHISDFDGDRRDDVLLPSDIVKSQFSSTNSNEPIPMTDWYVKLSRGFSMVPVNTGAETTAGFAGASRTRWRGPRASAIGDFNGDRVLDFVYVKDPNTSPRLALRAGRREGQMPGTIRQITEGSRRRIDIQYVDDSAAVRSETRYRPSEACPTGVRCELRAPAGTVANVTVGFLDASRPKLTTEYAYRGGWSSPRWGWCGYQSEVATFKGSTRGFLRTEVAQYERHLDPASGAIEGCELPQSVDKVTPIAIEIGRAVGVEGVHRRELSVFHRERSTPEGADALGSAEHSVFEQPVTLLPSGLDAVDGFGAVFSNRLMTRRETHGVPDEFGNPTSRQVSVLAVDANGTEQVLSEESVVSLYAIDETDRAAWTVSEPHQVTWTVSQSRGALSASRTTVVTHAHGLVSKIEEKGPTGNALLTSTFQRDSFGRPQLITEEDPLQLPRARLVLYQSGLYFPSLVFQQVVDPLDGEVRSLQTIFGIDEATGLTWGMRDPAGLDTLRAYDGFGRLLWESRPDGTDTAVSYSRAEAGEPGWSRVRFRSGAASAVGDEPVKGAEQLVFYDELERAVATRRRMPLGKWSQVMRAYDESDNLKSETAPHEPDELADYTLRFKYDALGRMIETQSPRGTRRVAYLSRQTWSDDVREQLTFDEHDEWTKGLTTWAMVSEDEVAARTVASMDAAGAVSGVASSVGARTRYSYDPLGNLSRTIDHDGNVIRLDRDNYGRLVHVTDADGFDRTYNYFGTGELRSETFGGDTTSYVYDTIGRIVGRQRGARGARWSWDRGGLAGQEMPGRLLRATSTDGSVAYGYDETTGRLGATEHQIAKPYVTSYKYDEASRLFRIDYPAVSENRPFAILQDFDDFGNLTSVRPESGPKYWEVTEAFRGYLPKTIRWGDGIVESLDYAAEDHQLTGIERRIGASLVDSSTYDYWPTGNVRSRTRGGLGESFHYDDSGRLETIREGTTGLGTPKWQAVYSKIGNITSTTQAGSLSYVHADNVGRPHAVASTGSGFAYWYDSLGRVSRRMSPSGEQIEVAYGLDDLPVSLTSSGPEGSSVTELGYGADARRLWRNRDGIVTVYAGLYRETFDRDSPDARTARYSIQVNGEEVASVERASSGSDDVVTYVHRDRVRSAELVRTSSGAQRSIDHAAFGSAADGVAFATHETMVDEAFVDMGGRFYDPAVGRFLTADPLVQDPFNAESLNRYSYAWNNPLNLVDPSGFQNVDQRPRAGNNWIGGSDIKQVDDWVYALGQLGEASRAIVDPAVTASKVTSFGTANGGSTALTATLQYLDRNHLAILNAVGDLATGWGNGVSFGLAGAAQRVLHLDAGIVEDSWAYQLGNWGALASPGGWRTLITNPVGVARSALSTGRLLAVHAGGAMRSVLKGAARVGEGARGLALRMIDALPVPGLGADGIGGVTIGALRAAARGLPKALNISAKQFGKKLGQKAGELGLNPASARDRFALQDRIQRIFSNADEVRTGLWRGLGEGGSEGSAFMFRRGQDVVVITPAGDFVTLLEGGATNTRFLNGAVVP